MMDDAYLNGQARVCGWQATLVYNSLCRHANIGQESFPSIKLMSEELGVGRKTIMKGIEYLEKYNVIQVKKNRNKGGKWLNNTYILIDKSEWIKSHVLVGDLGNHVPVGYTPCPSQAHDQVPVGDTKETHTEGNTYKETHIAKAMAKPDQRNTEVQEIIDYFTTSLDGLPMDGTHKENRQYTFLMINKIKKLCLEQNQDNCNVLKIIKAIILASQKGWHQKNATSMKYIYYNMGKIIQETKAKKPNFIQI